MGKIYVAASQNNQRHPQLIAALTAAGHECFDACDAAPKHAPNLQESRSQSGEFLLQEPEEFLGSVGLHVDFDALGQADAIVLAWSLGKASVFELGHGLGSGQKTILLAGPYHEVGPLRLAKHHCHSIDEVVKELS